MSTNKRPVPPNGSIDSEEADHSVKKGKLEEEAGDDMLQRLQNEVERAIAALKAKQEDEDADDNEIVDLDKNLREAQHTLHVGENLRREAMYNKTPERKESDKKTFYWCENRHDNNKSFLLLPKLKYYDWRDFRSCPTWGDMRSCVSKDFYESVIMKRRNDLLSPNGHVDKDQKKRLEKSSEDGTKFYCGTTFRKDIHEGMSGDLYSEQFGDIGEGDDRFPPYIEQIMYDLYDSDKEFDWLDEYIGIEEGGHRFHSDLKFSMKDKDEIFAKIRAKGYKTEHEPELVNLTTSVRSNATLLYELYSDEWESGW